MDLYSISLFVHMIGLISLFGGFVILQNVGARLRRASTWQEARPWLDLMLLTRGMFGGGAAIMVLSGAAMTGMEWSFGTPWIVVAIVLVVAVGVAGPLVVGRRFAALRDAGAVLDGPISAEHRRRIFSPVLWAPAFAMNGGALAVIWLMTTKPGWTVSMLVPVVMLALGWFAGSMVPRSMDRASRAPARMPQAPMRHRESGAH